MIIWRILVDFLNPKKFSKVMKNTILSTFISGIFIGIVANSKNSCIFAERKKPTLLKK